MSFKGEAVCNVIRREYQWGQVPGPIAAVKRLAECDQAGKVKVTDKTIEIDWMNTLPFSFTDRISLSALAPYSVRELMGLNRKIERVYPLKEFSHSEFDLQDHIVMRFDDRYVLTLEAGYTAGNGVYSEEVRQAVGAFLVIAALGQRRLLEQLTQNYLIINSDQIGSDVVVRKGIKYESVFWAGKISPDTSQTLWSFQDRHPVKIIEKGL